MKKVSVTVYHFSELREKVQESLKQEAVEFLVDGKFESFNEYAVEFLKAEYGISAEIYYSLSYCQGDGFRFETKDFLTDEVLEILANSEDIKNNPEGFALLKQYKEEGYHMPTKHNGHYHYEYATPRDVEYDDEFLEDKEREDGETFDKAMKAVSSLYMEICRNLEKQGYTSYDITDEELDDLLGGDNLYYADGRVYNEED